MQRWIRIAAVLGLAIAPLATPQRQPPAPVIERDAPPPNAVPRKEDILKADHQQDLKDAAQLLDLSQQLKDELEKNDRHVLSIDALKKTEEIEKLAKRIRSRMRRF